MNEYKMGCLPDPKPRKAYRLIRPFTDELASIILPPSYTIAEAAKVPVYDQRNLGSCTSFASGNAFEIRQNIVSGKSQTVCHLQIYQCALVYDGSGRDNDVGSSLSSVAYVLENYGVAPESEYSYDTSKFGKPIPANVLADAKKNELIKAIKLDADDLQTTINNTKAAIAPNPIITPCYPVMFGMNVYNNFMKVGSDGNIPSPAGKLEGGHALCLFGYDDNHVNGSGRSNGAFRGRNSWNPTWGLQGDFWLGYDIILNIKDDFGDAWALIDESVLPKPTPTPPKPVPPVPTPPNKACIKKLITWLKNYS